MKINLLVFLSIAACTHVTSNVKAQESFSKDTVITAIDQICGDVWCEGDYDYKFNSISFDTKNNTTILFFQMIDSLKRTYNEKCNIIGYSKPEEILTSYGSLQSDFYDKLNTCISSKGGK